MAELYMLNELGSDDLDSFKKSCLNGLNHLISPGSVKSKLKMRDHNSEITPEAAKEIKHSEKG